MKTHYDTNKQSNVCFGKLHIHENPYFDLFLVSLYYIIRFFVTDLFLINPKYTTAKYKLIFTQLEQIW